MAQATERGLRSLVPVSPAAAVTAAWRALSEAMGRGTSARSRVAPGFTGTVSADTSLFPSRLGRPGSIRFGRLPLAAFSDTSFPCRPDVWQVLQWARGHIKYGVLHIHGLYTDPCGMVLDPSGYKDVTQDPEVMVRPWDSGGRSLVSRPPGIPAPRDLRAAGLGLCGQGLAGMPRAQVLSGRSVRLITAVHPDSAPRCPARCSGTQWSFFRLTCRPAGSVMLFSGHCSVRLS